MTARAESRAARDPGSALRARGRTILVVALLVVAAAGVAPAAAQEETVDCSFPVTLTDATGTAVTVEEEPQRVVVLAPSAAQTMWEIGAEETVVGMPVNRFTAYLNGSEERTNVVGEGGQVDVERVVGLDPDLVLAPNITPNETVAQLRDAGLTVYRFDIARSMADVHDETRVTGRLVGEYDAAAERAARTEAQVAAVREAVGDADRPRVYHALGGGFTAGTNTFIHEVITAAGGDNIAAAANITSYARISQEVIAREDPEWIVVNEGMPVPRNAGTNDTTAIREEQVVRVNPNFLNQPGPYVVRALVTLAESFHPGAMAGVDVSSVSGEVTTTCAGASTETDTAPTTAAGADGTAVTDAGTATPVPTDTTSAGAPGFGAIGALVAVATLALLAGRRSG